MTRSRSFPWHGSIVVDVAGIIGGPGGLEQAVIVANFDVEGGQAGEVEPVDVVVEGPPLRATGPDAAAGTSHGDVAVVGTRQNVVYRVTACRKDAWESRSLRRDRIGGVRPIPASASARIAVLSVNRPLRPGRSRNMTGRRLPRAVFR